MEVFTHFLDVTMNVAKELEEKVKQSTRAMLSAKDHNEVLVFDGRVDTYSCIIGHKKNCSRGKIVLTAVFTIKRTDEKRDEVLKVDVNCAPGCFVVKATASPIDNDPRGVTRELHSMISTATADDVLSAVSEVIYQAIAGNLEQ